MKEIYVGGYFQYVNIACSERFVGRIYDLKINGIPFKPYEVDGVAGLLRTDTMVFFPSEGSENFVAGPEEQ